MAIEYYPAQVDEAFVKLNQKREEARKKRLAESAERETKIAEAKAELEKEYRKYPDWSSPHRLAADARYNARVEEITGVKARKDQLERDYIKVHGHGFIPGMIEWRETGTPAGTPMSVVNSPRTALGIAAAGKEAERSEPVQPWTPERIKAIESKTTIAGHEVKAFKSTLTAGNAGEVIAMCAVSGNVDRGGDQIVPGAFAKYIARVKSGERDYPPFLYGHGVDQGLGAVLGSIKQIDELYPGNPELPERLLANGWGGVRVKAKLNLNTDSGRTAWELIKAGDVTTLSFMYELADGSAGSEYKGGVRLLKEIAECHEVSLVPLPMNPEARTVSVNSYSADPSVQRIRNYVREQLRNVFADRSGAAKVDRSDFDIEPQTEPWIKR